MKTEARLDPDINMAANKASENLRALFGSVFFEPKSYASMNKVTREQDAGSRVLPWKVWKLEEEGQYLRKAWERKIKFERMLRETVRRGYESRLHPIIKKEM